MDSKYNDEYKLYVARIIRFFHQLDKAELESQSKLVCPRKILKMDFEPYYEDDAVLKFPKELEFIPRMMSEENNKNYRELIDPKLDINCFHDENLGKDFWINSLVFFYSYKEAALSFEVTGIAWLIKSYPSNPTWK